MSTEQINSWFNLFLAVAASATVVVGVFRWLNRSLEHKIVAELREATRQIQPLTNGGLSLTDLHGKVDRLCVELEQLRSALLALEDDVAAIEQDLEEQ